MNDSLVARDNNRMIRFRNTLTGQLEEFAPLDPPRVRIYTCGPTVYDFAHIGNFRTFVFQDILRRHLRARGFQLLHVMNITDVDDRIIENAAAAGLSLRDYTEKFTQGFFEDMRALNLETPQHLARATDHIPDMVALIERLAEKSFTYTSDGSLYFRISKFPAYGKLSKVDLGGIQPGARVDVDRYEKADARDFALWKARKPGEHFWDSPFGPGRPGWHIECSAMAMKYLGETLDIHTGGIDLAFPHHENEIAQSEAATGKPFVRYWLHAEHLIVEGEKMSKSLGNFFTLRDLFARGHKPSAIRYLLASVPYRRQLNFTFAGLQQAASSVERLRNFRLRLRKEKFPAGSSSAPERAHRAMEEFGAALDDDLNTAEALAAVFNLVRDTNAAMDRGEFCAGDAPALDDALDRFDAVFAVLDEKIDASYGVAGGLTDAEVEALLAERRTARGRRDFKRADEIRQELTEKGIIVEDTKDGARWKRA
ncbi:MAG: cysteine--tRNA ligase [Candidatus Acidiferrales bacterium]